MNIKDAAVKLSETRFEIQKIIVGYDVAITIIIATLIAGGHVSLKAVPGLGKTLLIKVLSYAAGGKPGRIQFTPDLQPGDVTGHLRFNRKTDEYEPRFGPVFGINYLLADEINRALPKTLSGLLEAAEENQVTIDGVSYPLADVFFIMSTENPIEHEGTFEVPEAQLDRFMVRVEMDYLEDEDDELEIVNRLDLVSQETVNEVISLDDIVAIRKLVKSVSVDPRVKRYAVDLARATRVHPAVVNEGLGVSPRGTKALIEMARALAVISGRNYAIPDDVAFIAPYVFEHRVIPGFEDFDNSVMPVSEIVQEVIASVNMPDMNLSEATKPALEVVRSA